MPQFAVRLAAPDLRPWLGGNCGIAGAWSFTAPEPGPHLALFALTHGNEIAGALVLNPKLSAGIRPQRGRVSFVFGNLDDFQPSHTENPIATPYLQAVPHITSTTPTNETTVTVAAAIAN